MGAVTKLMGGRGLGYITCEMNTKVFVSGGTGYAFSG